MAAVPAARSDPDSASELHALLSRRSTGELAGDRLVPLLPAVAEVLGVRGLQRGSTVVLDGSSFSGATALLLALVAQATDAGMWAGLFGLSNLGFLAAAELGVCLERVVLVPEVAGRTAMFLATLFEGCDVVCAALSRPLSAVDGRRLVARARERRGVLVVLECSPSHGASRRRFPGEGDLSISVTGGRFVGLAEEGRIRSRLVEVEVRRRRGGAPRHGSLWLPARDGRVLLAKEEEVEERALTFSPSSEAIQ
jgi:hypothetical protein